MSFSFSLGQQSCRTQEDFSFIRLSICPSPLASNQAYKPQIRPLMPLMASHVLNHPSQTSNRPSQASNQASQATQA